MILLQNFVFEILFGISDTLKHIVKIIGFALIAPYPESFLTRS